MVVFGVDLSDFDRGRGPVDVAAMARDGIQFLTHKATEGTKVQHVHYGEALNRARDAGMPFMGAYVVPRTPGNNGHGQVAQQAAYFLSYLDQQTPWWRSTPEFFLQVDTEHWGYDDVSSGVGAGMCSTLRNLTGKWVVHYAPRWSYGDTIPGTDPLWASDYGTNPAAPYRQAYPGDGSSGWAPYSGRTPTILQYGSRLTIGSQPGCDANAFRGSLDELRALITGGPTMTPEQEAELLRNAHNADWGVTQLLQGQDPAAGFIQRGGAEFTVPNRFHQLLGEIKAAVNAQAAGGVTQAMHDAAILKAMQDPTVLKGIGDAIASHIHVS